MKRVLVAIAAFFLCANLYAVKVFSDTVVANLPTCASVTTGTVYYVTNGASSTDCSTGGGSTGVVCVCNGTSWGAVGGAGGSGDITDVWGCSTGDCSALTAAAGDTVDATLADTTIPWRVDDATDPTAAGEVAFQPSNRRIAVGSGAATLYFYDGVFASTAFSTVNAPSGTDPVADSSSDTLNLTSGAAALSITGDSTTDTVTFDIAGTSSRCARFDGSGELVPASADCPSGMTGIIFDIGDDGGNDSTSVAEIATVADDYAVMTEPSADKIKIDFAKLPPYRQYDPDRPPSSCATCDEFTGGTTLSFSWQNQESSTATAELDGLTLSHPADTTGVAIYYFTGPDGSSTDWVFSARVGVQFFAATNQVGIGVLATGTEASPTLLYLAMFYSAPTNSFGLRSMTSYTSAQTSIGSSFAVYTDYLYVQLRYVSSTKVLTAGFSHDGILWVSPGTNVTLAAHPTTSFFLEVASVNASNPSAGNFRFIRVRTDATGTATPFPCGE